MTIATGTTGGGGNGDISVNSAINWTTDNTLTLSAYRNIKINANITNNGSRGCPGLAGRQYGTGFGTVNFGGTANVGGDVSVGGNPYRIRCYGVNPTSYATAELTSFDHAPAGR